MDVSDWNQRASMQKSQLFALSILFFDETFSQRTFAGNITFQPVSELFIDTEGKPAEILTDFRCDAVILMQSRDYGIVVLQLHELRGIIWRMSQFLYLFRQFFMCPFVCLIAHMRPYGVFLSLLSNLQLKTKEIGILPFQVDHF